MRASSVPMMMPPVVASAVSSSVNRIPSKNRYGSERAITSKSKLENIALVPDRLRPGTEIARNRDATLERLHAERRDDVDDDVDDGCRRKRLEDLERELLHRTCACGQLHQTDGERDRTVLDGVEKLRRQRRQDDAIGHRQEHIRVS